MFIIHTNGTVEVKPYETYNSISETVTPPGRHDPFTTVPLLDRNDSGYTAFANDNGMLIPLPRNPVAEEFTGYPEIYGDVCFASFEESGEDEFWPLSGRRPCSVIYIKPKNREAFLAKMRLLQAAPAPSEPIAYPFSKEYSGIPDYHQNSLYHYVLQGQPLGGFLEAVVSNDLADAAVRADLVSRECLVHIAQWLSYRSPPECHGSRKAYTAWLSKRGLRGRK